MSRLLALTLLAACSGPAPADALRPAPVPKASPVPAPVPQDSPAAREPPVPKDSPPAVPHLATTPHGPLPLYLAALSDAPVTLTPLADDAVALRVGLALAVAPPRAGPPRRDPAWLRGLPRSDFGSGPDEIKAFGGRWPDATFLSLYREGARSGFYYQTQRWQADRWTDVFLAEPELGGLANKYSAFTLGHAGAVLGLRTQSITAEEISDADLATLKAALARAQPSIDRLDDPAPPAWPQPPAGRGAIDLHGYPDGTLVLLRPGPTLELWTPGAPAWKPLPALGYTARAIHERPTVAGRDPARIYLHFCPETPADKPRLHRYAADKWQPITPPDATCVRSLAEDHDGALWLVSDEALYRHPAPAPIPGVPAAWEQVKLPAIDLPARPAAWRNNTDVFEWHEYPALPAATVEPDPTTIATLGAGELWIAAAVGPSRFGSDTDRRTIVLTTRELAAPLELPDRMRFAIETSLVDEQPATADSECRTLQLELGTVTDAPALARPSGLTGVPLDDLTLVVSESGTRHDLALVWLRDAPEPAEAHARLTALATRLHPAFPRRRLRCSLPAIVAVLP